VCLLFFCLLFFLASTGRGRLLPASPSYERLQGHTALLSQLSLLYSSGSAKGKLAFSRPASKMACPAPVFCVVVVVFFFIFICFFCFGGGVFGGVDLVFFLWSSSISRGPDLRFLRKC